jgi:hypothetical protein
MKRIDRIVELAARLAEARAVAAMLEAELEAMLGKGGESDRPGRRLKQAKAPGNGVDGGAALPPAASNGHGKVKRGQRMAQVAQLAKDGFDVPTIAETLGITRACAAITLRRARSNGLAPKAEASR